MKKLALITAAVALTGTSAIAADPTYTSQMGEALEALNITNLLADISAFLGALFAIVGVSVGFEYVTRRFRRAAR